VSVGGVTSSRGLSFFLGSSFQRSSYLDTSPG
jgi:hypothetical protein